MMMQRQGAMTRQGEKSWFGNGSRKDFKNFQFIIHNALILHFSVERQLFRELLLFALLGWVGCCYQTFM